MKPQFLTRDQVGLAAPNLSRLGSRFDLVAGITWHCTGAPTRDPLGKWRQIQELAMEGKLPSRDLYGDHPYNAGIVLDGPFGGSILPGRDPKWIGAHAASTHNVANRITLGVAILGDGSRLTPAAITAMSALVYVLAFGTYKRGLVPFDHRDWKALGGIATACPGSAVERQVDVMRAHARK